MGVCEEEIFRSIFNRWQKPLQHFLQSRGMEMNIAADQVQECFLRLWNNCAEVEETKSKSFLFTVASRLQIDQFRKTSVRLKYKSDQRQIEKEDGQYALEMKEFKKRYEEALNSMNENSRVVFMMHRHEGFSYSEIAESLEIGKKAVEKRMGKALHHLVGKNILKKK